MNPDILFINSRISARLLSLAGHFLSVISVIIHIHNTFLLELTEVPSVARGVLKKSIFQPM